METDIAKLLTALTEKVDLLVKESKESRKFRLKVEAEVIPQVKLLSDGFQGYTDRIPAFDKMADDIDTLKLDMAVVKAVMKQQSNDIGKLKAIK